MRKKGHKSSGNLFSVLGFGAIPNKQSVDCPDRYTACDDEKINREGELTDLSFFVGDNIEKGNLLAANKKKADGLLRSIGKSYPKENTFISFN